MTTTKLSSVFAAAAFALAGCQAATNQGSQLKIHGGHNVVASDAGPERTSTVGISGKYPLNPPHGYLCTATLIASDLILTAAHCVDKTATVSAYFGTNILAKPLSGVLIPIAATAVDPGYAPIAGSEQIVPDDVALMRLESPAPDGYVPVPVLSDDSFMTQGATVRMAGFGTTDDANGAGTLRYVDSTFDSEDDQGRIITADPLYRGACKGDSGGPLYVDVDGTWYVAGALSGGPDPCGQENVYTSTAAFYDFIENTSL